MPGTQPPGARGPQDGGPRTGAPGSLRELAAWCCGAGGLLLPGTARGRLSLCLRGREVPAGLGRLLALPSHLVPRCCANAAPLQVVSVLGLTSTSPAPAASTVRPQPAEPCAFNPAASPQHLAGTRTAPRPGRCTGGGSARAWRDGFSVRSRCPASCSCPVPLWPPCARPLFCSELTSGPPGFPSARGLETRGWGPSGASAPRPHALMDGSIDRGERHAGRGHALLLLAARRATRVLR